MEVLAALFCIAIFLWLTWRWRWTSTFQKMGIPGPKPNLIFGNLIELYRKGPFKCQQEWTNKYGRVLGYYYGMKPALLISDPVLLKNIFIRDFSKFVNREEFNPIDKYNPHDREHQSVLILKGQHWKNVRSVLTPTFTAKKMKQTAVFIIATLDEMLKILQDRQGEDVDFLDMYQRLTMDVITRTAFGVKMDIINNPKSDLLKVARTFFELFYKDYVIFLGLSFPILSRLCLKLERLSTYVRNYGRRPLYTLQEDVSEVIQYRRDNPQIKNADLLQLMIDSRVTVGDTEEDFAKLEAGNTENEKIFDSKVIQTKATRPLTKNEIIATSSVIMLAGYETSSTTLAFITYLIAKDQVVQERLFQEIDQIIQKGESLEYGNINKLAYLDKVFSEGLRLYPPVALFTNRYAMADVQYDDLFIPEGTLIQCPAYMMHHDPAIWSDPETFDPERFENKQNTDGINYLPFGVGPRNCLGMRFAQLEVKLGLAKVVHKFHLTLSDRLLKTPLKVTCRIRTITPLEGVHLKLQLREKAN